MVGADPMEDLVDPFKGFEFYAEGTRSCWGLEQWRVMLGLPWLLGGDRL